MCLPSSLVGHYSLEQEGGEKRISYWKPGGVEHGLKFTGTGGLTREGFTSIHLASQPRKYSESPSGV